MRKGWYKESYRHSLAARGVKTNKYFQIRSATRTATTGAGMAVGRFIDVSRAKREEQAEQAKRDIAAQAAISGRQQAAAPLTGEEKEIKKQIIEEASRARRPPEAYKAIPVNEWGDVLEDLKREQDSIIGDADITVNDQKKAIQKANRKIEVLEKKYKAIEVDPSQSIKGKKAIGIQDEIKTYKTNIDNAVRASSAAERAKLNARNKKRVWQRLDDAIYKTGRINPGGVIEESNRGLLNDAARAYAILQRSKGEA